MQVQANPATQTRKCKRAASMRPSSEHIAMESTKTVNAKRYSRGNKKGKQASGPERKKKGD